MPFTTFYINGNTLSQATAVFTDAALTTTAPDAYYSDGSVVRQQTSGVLLSSEVCPACSDSCPNTISVNNVGMGLYKLTVGVTTGTGAVLVRINVDSLADGFRVKWDGNWYNQLSCANDGYLGTGSSTTLPIWLGNAGDAGCQPAGGGAAGLVPIPCPAVCTDFQNMTTYNYNWSDNTWSAIGASDWVVNAAEVQTTAGNPGSATLVIPKTTAGPDEIEIEVYGPCMNTGWEVQVDCPVALTGISTTGTSVVSSVAACGDATATTLYNAPVNGTPGVPGLYDWIYTDAAGTTLLAPGADTWYKYVDGGVNKWFKVSTDSVITLMNNC